MTAPTKDLRPPLSPTRRRLSGLVLLLVMVLVVTGCLLNFNKVFKPVEMVTLQTDTVGNQLSKQGDVKVRGVIVGEIKSVDSDGERATVQMAMDPDALTAIPSNVTAMLVPKTLFGERYVSLNIPPNPTPRRLQEGDVITQDRSQNATETEQVLNNLMPVLTAVQPQKLSDTLGAISEALSGRGQQLGGTLVQLNQLLEGTNPSLPDLLAVINRLSPTADIYNAATPDLIGALDNLVTTSRTLVQQRAAFESTFRTVTSAANVTTDFLAVNRNNIINLAATSLPVLDLLARYSPEFPCLLSQLTNLTPKINQVLSPTTGIKIAAEIT
ncbi:MAG: phospholipid/cholesterol/gamma-HCH transport system substrate-binding protein, partial [Solirubrobacteraceae bacterium]|nr:phospholipid/cholesterol/gamma-HCH transport system substrate-binding protein [Solirubrobacteraceae bacterium]